MFGEESSKTFFSSCLRLNGFRSGREKGVWTGVVDYAEDSVLYSPSDEKHKEAKGPKTETRKIRFSKCFRRKVYSIAEEWSRNRLLDRWKTRGSPAVQDRRRLRRKEKWRRAAGIKNPKKRNEGSAAVDRAQMGRLNQPRLAGKVALTLATIGMMRTFDRPRGLARWDAWFSVTGIGVGRSGRGFE